MSATQQIHIKEQKDIPSWPVRKHVTNDMVCQWYSVFAAGKQNSSTIILKLHTPQELLKTHASYGLEPPNFAIYCISMCYTYMYLFV